MTYYIKSGNTFSITSEENIDIHKSLPLGTFVVSTSLERGFFLKRVDDIKIDFKVYGDVLDRADRIINTYHARPNNTGALLRGEKGSGKTLLSKQVSIVAREKHNMPTIIVNQAYSGDGFNTFMQQIDQECVVLFDEFEKVYDAENQEAILTLLDGVFPSKKLFMFTINDTGRVDKHMLNRPGRMFYSLEYSGLTLDFVREYCKDNLDNLDHVEKIVNLVSIFDKFNFDMLKSLIEEMNRYNETPQEALRMLNIDIKGQQNYPSIYTFEVMFDDAEKQKEWADVCLSHLNKEREVNIYNPIMRQAEFYIYKDAQAYKYIEYDGCPEDWTDEQETQYETENKKTLKLNSETLIKLSGDSMIFQVEAGMKVRIQRKYVASYDYTAAL